MRWDREVGTEFGHVPRGDPAATAGLDDVDLVLLVAEPGDPHAGTAVQPGTERKRLAAQVVGETRTVAFRRGQTTSTATSGRCSTWYDRSPSLSSAQEGEHPAALATLNEVLALVEEAGLAAPEAFWFRHAQAASVAGEHAQAVESVTRYVTTAGRAGAHYRAALELLEREREAARRAERERRQAEARAEAAYTNQRENAAASPRGSGTVFADALQSGGRGPALVVLAAGSFRMGCLANDDGCYADEKPVHDGARGDVCGVGRVRGGWRLRRLQP